MDNNQQNDRDLRIDLSQFYGQQAVGMTREDFRKVQDRIIRSDAGGAEVYQEQMRDLHGLTQGKVLVDQNELEQLRRENELNKRYRNTFSQPNTTQQPNDFVPPVQPQSTQQPISPNTNEGENTNDYFSNLFKRESTDTSQTQTQTPTQTGIQSQAQQPAPPASTVPQTPERQPNQQLPNQENENINSNDLAQLRNEFYNEAINSGIDPEQAIDTLQSMSVKDFLDYYKYKTSQQTANPQQPKFRLKSLESYYANNQQQPVQHQQARSPQREPISLQEMPDVQHPLAFKNTQTNKSIFD